MKKIFLSLIVFLFIPVVYGIELSELDNYVIKYRFYKDIFDSKYYPKGEPLEGYIEDDSNIEYTDYTLWQDNCIVNDNKEIEYKKEYVYQEIKKVGSIKIFDFSSERDQTGIIIYEGNKKINYKDVSPSWKDIYIELDNYYNASDFLIYAFFLNKVDYTITMYSDYNFQEPILTKRITRSNFYNVLVDSKFYVYPDAYVENSYENLLEDNFFRKKIRENTKCRYRDILTYRYKIDKEYYDDNYYIYLEGYQKDYDDFKIYYQKDINYIEVLKVDKEYIYVPEYKYFEIPKYEYIEVPKYEYIEVEKETPINIEPIPIIKKEYIKEETREVDNNSSKYILIIIILILLFVIYRLIKKCRTN